MPAHPTFTPDRKQEALDFFAAWNYVVVSDALPPGNIRTLTGFVDRSEREIASEWGPDKLGCRSHAQILVHHPELDGHVRPPLAWDLVDAILGPDTRFSQFDFRDLWDGAATGPMRWHRDRSYLPRAADDPNPRWDCSYVCAIHYLTDVGEEQPCFAVVPNSQRCGSFDEAREELGEDFRIVPVRGPAGTVVLYNIGILHTRVHGAGRRLTQHNYFSREQSPPLTDWVMLPRRLTEHPDPEVRTFYSQWTKATRAFAAAGYSDEYYYANVMDKPT